MCAGAPLLRRSGVRASSLDGKGRPHPGGCPLPSRISYLALSRWLADGANKA